MAMFWGLELLPIGFKIIFEDPDKDAMCQITWNDKGPLVSGVRRFHVSETMNSKGWSFISEGFNTIITMRL